MKKKVIIVVVSLLVFCMCVVFGYIITSRKNVKNANEAKVDTSNQENTETANNEQVSKNEEKNNNNGEKIVVNSNMGNEILKNFNISNIYSSEFYKLLDSEGLSDRVKRSWAFIEISQGNSYTYMQEYSDEDANTYISSANMATVINNIFDNSVEVKDGELIYNLKFNFDTKKYEIPSIGIANSQDLIVVEVPFDILEYDNRYEAYMYRIYLVQKMEESLDESQVNMKTIAYYDSSLLTKACEIDDEDIYSDLNTQKTVLSEQISKGKIDKNILQKVKYTLVKKGSNYKVTKYDKL